MITHALLLTLVLTPLCALPAQDLLTKAQMEADLAQFARALTDHHPGLHRYTSKAQFENALTDARAAANDPMSSLAFFDVIARATAAVRCGHTRTRPGLTEVRRLAKTGHQLPLTLQFAGSHTLVIACSDDDADIPDGCELLRIDDIPMAELRARLLERIPGDGRIETGRLRSLERDFALYYALHITAAPATFRLTLRDPSGKAIVREVRASRFRPPSHRDSRPPLEFEVDDDGIATLSVRTFSSGRIESSGIQYDDFLQAATSRMRADGITKLILDLRGNSGGTDRYGATLVSHLCPHEFGYFERIEVTANYDGIGGVRTDDQGRRCVTEAAGLGQQQPAEHAFRGQLVVLIDGRTFSTAADVAAVLRHQGVARFVGEETAGGCDGNTSGSDRRVQLQNSGILVSIPQWMYTTANQGHDRSGRGVRPDHAVAPTLEDLRRGRDPVLTRALALLTADK